MRFAARQHATARLLDAGAGECDLAPWFAAVGNGPGLLILDGLVAIETRVGDRTATELLGAGDLLQPPEPQRGRAARLRDRVARAPPDPARAARRRVRRARAAVAADRPARCSAARSAGRPSSTCSARSPASRGSRSASCCCCGTWRALGPGRADRHPLDAPADPPAARPARGRRAAVDLARARAARPRPASSPAPPATAPARHAGDASRGADRAHRARSRRASRTPRATRADGVA